MTLEKPLNFSFGPLRFWKSHLEMAIILIPISQGYCEGYKNNTIKVCPNSKQYSFYSQCKRIPVCLLKLNNNSGRLYTRQGLILPSISSVQSLSRVQLFTTSWAAAHQDSRPSPTPTACSNACPLSQWCHPTIMSSVVPFSSCPQSFPAPGSFPMNQFFASGGQSIGVSASVLPMNIQVDFLQD